MSRPKKQKIEINNNDSLTGLLQEAYGDACAQINQAQNIMNEVTNTQKPETVNDSTAIAKAKTDALKIKESGIKIKLEIAKLQTEIIKQNGNTKKVIDDLSKESATSDDFKKVRELMLNRNKNSNNNINEE